MPWPKSRSGASCQRCGYGDVTGTRHPNHREKYVALGDQDLAGFRSDLLRRRCAAENPLYPAALHKCRLWETWRALLWARSIENVVEPGGRGLAFVAAPEELL